MIGLSQEISTTEISITSKELSIMVNYTRRHSRRREIQRINAPVVQALPSLMGFLGKESQKYPSSPTSINDVST